jgi:hypothetical protein
MKFLEDLAFLGIGLFAMSLTPARFIGVLVCSIIMGIIYLTPLVRRAAGKRLTYEDLKNA